MTPLRVLHLNSLLRGGGTDDRSVRIAHSLQKFGHDVCMAGPDGHEFSKIARDLGLPFQPIRGRGLLKLPLIFDTARALKRHRSQIIHARHGRDYWPAVFAARLSGVQPKIVLSRHLAKSPSSWFSRRFLLGQCDAMVAVSNFVAKVLRDGDSDPNSDNPERHYRPPMSGSHSKIHVVYGGFDMERFKPMDSPTQRQAWGLQPGHFAFAVVGGYPLPRGKGQREFLKAASQIHQQIPSARFLIIGRGKMKEILESDIVQFGLQGKAWLTFYCHDMPAAMNAIDCLVLPQVGTEAIPGVVCEAHACGKPVIVSDLDGIPEAFAPASYGELVPTGNIPALAAAMTNWAVRPALNPSGRNNLHEKVCSIFSLEKAAKNLTELYKSLLK